MDALENFLNLELIQTWSQDHYHAYTVTPVKFDDPKRKPTAGGLQDHDSYLVRVALFRTEDYLQDAETTTGIEIRALISKLSVFMELDKVYPVSGNKHLQWGYCQQRGHWVRGFLQSSDSSRG